MLVMDEYQHSESWNKLGENCKQEVNIWLVKKQQEK